MAKKKQVELKEVENFFNAIDNFKGIGREAKLVRPVVPIETWLAEEFYSGPSSHQIYPYWKRAIIKVFSSPVRINEVIITGSIGTGKSTVAVYMLAYKLYELSCYYPAQVLFNLMNSSKILLAYFNITKDIAAQVGFGQFRDLIDSIPYFQNIFKRNDKKDSMLEWKDAGIYVKSASSSNDVIGMNLISFFIDEANFFKGDGQSSGNSINDVQSKAMQLYNSVRTRGKSRFIVNGEDFTFNILVSSSMYASSFTEERIKISANDPHVMVFDAKIWEVKNPETYSKERFVVFSGNELIDPLICNSVADVNYIRQHYKLPNSTATTPNEAIKDIADYDIKKRFVEVPMNFINEFNGNIIQALQDIAGVPVAATGKLFSNRDSYAKALTDEKSPFIQDQIVISTATDTTIQDYFRPDWKPENIDKPRFMHIDQSLAGDSTGIAQCYIDSIDYDAYGLPKVNIKFDWMIRINPPKPPHKIDIAKVRSIIPWQEQKWGIRYGMISYDTFQSAEAVQDLMKSGYPVQYRSVDRTDKEYLDLTELYYQGRIHHYRNDWYEKELFNLNWFRAKQKVDHPPVNQGGCLRGNTKIKLLNGTSIEIKDLVGKDKFWIYGCLSDGTIVPTEGRNCHITKYIDKLYQIILDNGEVIETTDNHKFMLRDGSYMRADQLEIGQSLMPLYTRYLESTKNSSYEQILNNKTERWNFTHIYVYKWFNDDYNHLNVIHHYDINPRNNEPNNLKQLTRSEHMYIHREILCKLSAELRKNSSSYRKKQQKAKYLKYYGRDYQILDITFKDFKPIKPNDTDTYTRYKERYLKRKEKRLARENIKYHNITEWNKSTKAREISRTNAKKLNETYWNKPENKLWQKTIGKQNLKRALASRMEKEDTNWINKVIDSGIDYTDFTYKKFIENFGGGYTAVKRRVAKLKGVYNHKIVDIKVLYLNEPEPVYDITVDETSNFALQSGIFVHNSKDLSDAVCGSVANALEYPAVEEIQRENDIDYFLDKDNSLFDNINTDKDELMRGFDFIR